METTKDSLTELQKKNVLRMNNKESNQLTRECLRLSLMHLMKDHPFDKISISDIVRRAGVSRTAFYRNYTDKEDLLRELINILIQTMKEMCERPEFHKNPQQWFEFVFSNIREYKDTFSLFEQAGILQLKYFSIKSVSDMLYPTKDTEFKYMRVAADAAFFKIIYTWFKDGMKEDENYMASVCVNIFDSFFKKIT